MCARSLRPSSSEHLQQQLHNAVCEEAVRGGADGGDRGDRERRAGQSKDKHKVSAIETYEVQIKRTAVSSEQTIYE